MELIKIRASKHPTLLHQLFPDVDYAVVFLSPYVAVALLLCASPAADVTVIPPAAEAAS